MPILRGRELSRRRGRSRSGSPVPAARAYVSRVVGPAAEVRTPLNRRGFFGACQASRWRCWRGPVRRPCYRTVLITLPSAILPAAPFLSRSRSPFAAFLVPGFPGAIPHRTAEHHWGAGEWAGTLYLACRVA